eukprot:scaffold453_cov243-Pinguiococcus_pyrenoidosus.AAC.4
MDITTGGATAAVALLCTEDGERVLYTAGVGDSRVVLGRGARSVLGAEAVRLTIDHKPDNSDERKRVEQAGGFFLKERVLGILAVTRSFGDHGMKDFVSAEPETRRTVLSDSDKVGSGKRGSLQPVPSCSASGLVPGAHPCVRRRLGRLLGPRSFGASERDAGDGGGSGGRRPETRRIIRRSWYNRQRDSLCCVSLALDKTTSLCAVVDASLADRKMPLVSSIQLASASCLFRPSRCGLEHAIASATMRAIKLGRRSSHSCQHGARGPKLPLKRVFWSFGRSHGAKIGSISYTHESPSIPTRALSRFVLLNLTLWPSG